MTTSIEVGPDRNGTVAYRGIYQTGDQQTFGTQRGTDVSRLVTTVAKPGYAVGAITVKAGLGIDGFSITFMKVGAGQLDPSDSYESDWIGGKGGGKPQKLAGDGGLVVGLVGKTNKTNAGGIGLLVLPADTKK